MTSRLFVMPRIDVREAPKPRTPFVSGILTIATWRDDWARACARAAEIYAIPSRYSNGAPTVRKGGAEAFIGEDARKREVFEA